MNLIEIKNRLYTKNLTPGKTVYGERLIRQNNIEFREWDAKRSKLAAAISKGVKNPIKKRDIVLYLGAATGTTSSHVSDLVDKDGFVFALDFAPRVLRQLVYVCEQRKNMTPLLEDANHPENYKEKITKVDVIYQDIAQKNQVEILIKNANLFLKRNGCALIAIKSRSIDVTKKPELIFNEVKEELKKRFKIMEFKKLEPFQKDHCFFVCINK